MSGTLYCLVSVFASIGNDSERENHRGCPPSAPPLRRFPRNHSRLGVDEKYDCRTRIDLFPLPLFPCAGEVRWQAQKPHHQQRTEETKNQDQAAKYSWLRYSNTSDFAYRTWLSRPRASRHRNAVAAAQWPVRQRATLYRWAGLTGSAKLPATQQTEPHQSTKIISIPSAQPDQFSS